MRHLLLSGGPGHDFDHTSGVLADLFGRAGATTTIVHHPADAVAELHRAQQGERPSWDLFTVNALRWSMEPVRDSGRDVGERDRWAVSLDPPDVAVIERHVDSGGGLLALHTAVICFDGQRVWRRLIGAAWDWGRSDHPPLGPLDVEPTEAGADHPITARTAPFTVVDELYGHLDVEPDVVALLTGNQQGATHPVLWARRHGRGRVVTSLLGHGTASLAHPSHRALLARAASWATRTSTAEEGPST